VVSHVNEPAMRDVVIVFTFTVQPPSSETSSIDWFPTSTLMPTTTASLVFWVPLSSRPDSVSSLKGSFFGAACNDTGNCGVQSSRLCTIRLWPKAYVPDWSASRTVNVADALTLRAAPAVAEATRTRAATRTKIVTPRFTSARCTRASRRSFRIRWSSCRAEEA
jgi:hypothetical protein